MTDKKRMDQNFETKSVSIFDFWQQTIHENPHFSDEEFVNRDSFSSYSKEFLGKLVRAVNEIELPDFKSDELTDVFQFWRAVHEDHLQKGMSSRDTAMLIYSLKSSLMQYIKQHQDLVEDDERKYVSKLRNLLDLLGLLTFEVYSNEKDQLIDRQHDQIQYLQVAPKVGGIIGESPEMATVFKAIGLILENDVSVLLEGESGTGKDLLAQVIHSQSKRKDGPFITLNCGAIPKDLIESELFGHEKGAFTGADEQRLGKFELADNGTLFLDEIGEMPLEMQTKLLRVLQNKEIERVGSTKKVKVNVRVVAATNKDLQEEVDAKRFRLDLFYRLNVFPIRVPPLRERTSDIVPLAQHFIEKYSQQFSVDPCTLSNDAENYLLNQAWPGNIRELENLMQRMVIIGAGRIVTASMLQFKPGKFEPLLLESGLDSPKASGGRIRALDEIEKEALEHAVTITGGNIRKAAKELGISRTTFYNKAKKYGIEL